MMAAASLMIETFSVLRREKEDTKQRGMGETAFVNFFKSTNVNSRDQWQLNFTKTFVAEFSSRH
jgi:hypothetical protein